MDFGDIRPHGSACVADDGDRARHGIRRSDLDAEQRSSTTHATNGARDITLYDLSCLVPLSGARERPATGLLRDLLHAPSSRERERIVKRQIDDLGFDWLEYCTVSRAGRSATRRACMTTYAPKDWTRQYFGQNYHEIDPRREHSRRSSLPLVWDRQWLESASASHPQTPRLLALEQKLQDNGMGSGVFVRIVEEGHPTVQYAELSFASAIPSRRWIDDTVLGQALVIGYSLHDYICRHVPLDESQEADRLHAANLPKRQEAVLRLVARGLTDRVIAQQLGVSLHTVDYYLRHLRQHFAVHNRVQLVSAAAHLLG